MKKRLLFFVLIGILFNKKKMFLYEIFLIFVFLYFAFSAKRHTPLFAFVAVPIMASLWQDIIFSCYNRMFNLSRGWLKLLLQKSSEYFNSRSSSLYLMENKLKYHILPITLVSFFILFCGFKGEKLNIGLDRSRYPLEIVEYIKENNVKGNIFNQYGMGGFLIWALPDRKVFIDGRMDVYKKEISDPYLTILNLKEGWEDLLKKYSIEHIVARKKIIISRFLVKISDEWVVSKETDNEYLFSKKDNQ